MVGWNCHPATPNIVSLVFFQHYFGQKNGHILGPKNMYTIRRHNEQLIKLPNVNQSILEKNVSHFKPNKKYKCNHYILYLTYIYTIQDIYIYMYIYYILYKTYIYICFVRKLTTKCNQKPSRQFLNGYFSCTA